jgi:hypothetical protein
LSFVRLPLFCFPLFFSHVLSRHLLTT